MPVKKILFTSWYSGLGGGETDLLTLAQALDKTRYEPHLLIPREGELASQWQANGWPVHQVHWRGASTWFIPYLWAHFPVVARLKTLLANQQIDLVHGDYHTLPMVAPAARALGIPIMWTCHGWWFHPKLWQRHFLKSITGVARSKAIRDGFLGDPPFMPAKELPVVYSGVDTERFRPLRNEDIRAEVGISADAPVVVMIARFQAVKGHHHFLAMAQLILDALPDAHFLIAGEDTFGVAKDAAYRQQIIDTIQHDERLSQHVHLLGFQQQVEHVLQAADVLICPSNFESYGKVNLEAMACALPVVSSNQGGPTETVKHGETGYLLPAGDIMGFSQKVIDLLQNPQKRHKMGARGRDWVQARFSVGEMVAHYDQIFKRLLDNQ